MLFERTALPNGMRILTERVPEVRSASIGFWIGVGSRDEPSRLQGASHFLEHLLFKGTGTHSAREIAEIFDAVGGEANAFSSKEYTCLYGRVLDKDLTTATDVLSDMLLNPSIRDSDVESERNVVLEEIAMLEDSPEDLVNEVLVEAVFGDHPLAREVMGTVETVKEISADDLRDFHSRNYHPANIVVSAAGNVDHVDVVSQIEATFASKPLERVPRTPSIPAFSTRFRLIHRTTEQAHIAIGGLAQGRDHPSRFAWGVLDNLLGGGMSSRLFQEIREKRGLAYQVYSYRNMYSETGCYGIYAGTTPSNAKAVLEIIAKELDVLIEQGISTEELDRAKGHMKGGLVLGLEESSARMTRLGKSELVHGEILSIDEVINRVDAVTRDDVGEVASDLLPAERRVLSVIGPFTEDDFSGWA